MRIARASLAFLHRLWRNERGNFAMMLGLLAIPLLGFVGLAVDVGRAYTAKVQLQGACDTAALAAATMRGQSEAKIIEVATKFFYSNYAQTYWAPPATPTVKINGQSVTVTATATQTNFFVRLLGQDTFQIAATSQAMSQGKGLEVAMVLDITSSMSASDMTALKNASTTLVNTLFGDAATSDLLNIGIVPFSGSVRVDPTTAVNGNWIDKTGASSVARLNYDTSYVNNYAYALLKTPTGAGYMTNTPWVGCLEARPISGGKRLEETDDAPVAGDTLWVPFMSPDSPDNNTPLLTVKVATTANVTLSGKPTIDGVTVTNNMRILVKNQTTSQNNGIYTTPNSGSGAWTRTTDADSAAELNETEVHVTNGTVNGNTDWVQTAVVVTVGTSTVTFTKQALLTTDFPNDYLDDATNGGVGNTTAQALKRQKYTVKYQGKSPNTAAGAFESGVNKNCVQSAIQPLTNVKSTLLNIINGLTADGYTHIPLGIGWGWRVLSPTQPYTQGRAYTDPDWDKVLIIETDGCNTMPPTVPQGGGCASATADTSTPWGSEYSAYGFGFQERLGVGINTTTEMMAEQNNSMKRVCDNIKAVKKPDGTPAITIYTIGFGAEANEPTTKALLQGCASSPDKHYYYAPSQAELKAVFTAIAKELSKIRLTK